MAVTGRELALRALHIKKGNDGMSSVESTHPVPRASRLFPQTNEPAFSRVGDAGNPTTFEEQVRMNIILGNVIDGGFNNDVQTILCRMIHDVADLKQWLLAQIPQIAMASEVLTFNPLFKEIRARPSASRRPGLTSHSHSMPSNNGSPLIKGSTI